MNNWSTATQYANLSIYSNNEIVSSKKRETSATRALELDDGWENNSNIYLLSYQPKKKVNTNKKEDDENRKLTIDEINYRMQQLLMERSNISRNDAPRQQTS